MKQKQYCYKFNKDFQIWFTLKKNVKRKEKKRHLNSVLWRVAAQNWM